jgi:hypothetical protein
MNARFDPRGRYYVAAADATPAQMCMGGSYRDVWQAQAAANNWNSQHPDCPVVVFRAKTAQSDIAGTAPDLAGLARLKAAAPMKPNKAQEPCDIGLFSDSSSQLDLVTLANQARKS